MRQRYLEYLKSTCSETTAKKYYRRMDKDIREMMSTYVDPFSDSFFSYTTLLEASAYAKALQEIPQYVEKNEKGHREMSSAIRKYLIMLELDERKANGTEVECPYCGEQMVTDQTIPGSETYKYLVCPKCKTKESVTLLYDEREKQRHPAFNEELRKDFVDRDNGNHQKCPECGKYMDGPYSYMLSDIDEECPPSRDRLVEQDICPYCGAEIQIIFPLEK